MNIKTILQKLLSRKMPPAHLPYILTPPVQQPHASMSPNQFHNNGISEDNSYVETEADIHTIAGTDIGFGHQKVILVDSSGQAKDISQTQSHIIGSGKIVSKVEEITGVCELCQAIAMEQFHTGQISIQQAQLLSLYDKSSARICNNCGTQGCARHIRAVMTENGVLSMCGTCQQELKKQLRKRKIIDFLLSPFVETENPEK